MRLIWIMLLSVTLAYISGLMWYVNRMQERVNIQALPYADAIVVLTGGSERIAAGIQLLQTGKAKRLFISGVGEGVSLRDILAHHQNAFPYRDLISLGKTARNTRENATEVGAWMKEKSVRSFILVTSNYHIDRSMNEFNRLLPEAVIFPYPVHPETPDFTHWWHDTNARLVVFREYHKLLAGLMGITWASAE